MAGRKPLMQCGVPPAVVIVLSKEFISKPYPMEELQMLLERRRQGSTAVLLPVFYDVTWEEVSQKAEQYTNAWWQRSTKQQWAADLGELAAISGIRLDQVQTAAPIDRALCE